MDIATPWPLRADHQGRTLLHHAAEGHAAKALQALLKARSASEKTRCIAVSITEKDTVPSGELT